MTPYYEQDGITIYHGDCRDVLPNLQAGIVVTDPPYGMKKADWDMAIVPVGSWLPEAIRIGPTVVFTGVKGMYDYPRPDWVGAWVRLASTQRNGSLGGFNNWEPVLMYGLPRLVNDTFTVANYREIDGHPTPKPLRLMRKVISRLPDGCVVDPFAGSGTTLRAAKDEHRQAIGIEIEEKYCEIAAKRLSQRVLDLEFTA